MSENELTLTDAEKTLIEGIGDFGAEETPPDEGVIKEKETVVKDKDKEKEFQFDFGEFKGVEDKRGDSPRLKEITEKYPKLLEEFPEIRSRYYKAGEFAKIFSSIDAAREAAARVKTLEEIEEAVFEKGTAKELLTRIWKNDREAFDKLCQNMLEDIREISKDTYVDVITPILDDLILAIHARGEERDDENLSNAAIIINMFVHDTKSLPRGIQPRRRREDDRKEKDNLPDRYEQEKLLRAQAYVVDTVGNVLSMNLDKLVPKMKNTFIREALIDKIRNECYKQLTEDDIHVSNLNGLWKRAAKTGFDEDSIKVITRQVLQRLAREIPRVYSKFASAIPKEDKTETVNVGAKHDEPPTRPEKDKRIDWNRTTDLMALDGKYVYVGDK